VQARPSGTLGVRPATSLLPRPPASLLESAVIRTCPLDVWRVPTPPSLPARLYPCRSVPICGDQWFTRRRVVRGRRGCSPVPLVVPVSPWPDRWRSVAVCGSPLPLGAVVAPVLRLRRQSARIGEICGSRRGLSPGFCETNPIRHKPFSFNAIPQAPAAGVLPAVSGGPEQPGTVRSALRTEHNGPAAAAAARLRNEPNGHTTPVDNNLQRPVACRQPRFPRSRQRRGRPAPRRAAASTGTHRCRSAAPHATAKRTELAPSTAPSRARPPGRPRDLGHPPKGSCPAAGGAPRNEPNWRRARRHPERGHRADRGISAIRPGEALRPQEARRGTNRIRHKPFFFNAIRRPSQATFRSLPAATPNSLGPAAKQTQSAYGTA
jgi:hypothetical protein